ncbi:hypothetical protein [Aureitalea marina]|uniref:Outer membrane protein beta-barrel domain-containing protein n=1 Tax=Aureitalea marina TaxID=930804 RepID=A0A2S7KNU9_9FLAO|nr:hypothetical protein [Aureitalea marina]PQB04287.1 hypothetical protein BST85_04765 [Aureitalea marina]
MKKVLLLSLFVLLGQGLFAQGFQISVNGGLPVGNASDFADFAINVDAAYLFEAGYEFSAGPVIGYSHSFVDFTQTVGPITIDLDDVQFIPLAARGSWNFADAWTFQGDVGYAIGVNDGNDGGFYYSPRIMYWVSPIIGIAAAYRGVAVSNGGWNMLTLGVEFNLGGTSSADVE